MFIAPKARNSSRRKSSRIAGRKYAPLRKLLNASGAGLGQLSLAKIKSACEINNIRRDRVTCYMDENRLVRSFGEGQDG